MSVDLAKLNRPGVMSSYSSSKRKNSVHASKSQVAGTTFNQARLSAATKFLEPSKAGHVSARSLSSNGAPRYWNGQEMSMRMNRPSGQITSFQSNNFISGGFNSMGMGNMFGMGMDPTVGTIIGLTNIGMSLLDKFGVFGGKQVQVQSAGQQLNSVINTATTLTTDNVNFEGVSEGISNAISSGNPDDLSKAITSGHNKLAAMDGMTATYEAAVKTETQQKEKLGEQAEKADAKLSEANTNVTAKQAGVDKAQRSVDEKKQEASKFGETYQKANSAYVDAHNKHIDAQNETKASQKAFDNASKEYNNAVAAFGKATQAATDATNAYNAEPAVDKNGNPNPKKDQLRAKMNLAIEQKNKAEEAKNAAEQAKNDAQTRLDNARNAETAAKNNETTAKGELDKARENVTQNKQELSKYENELKAQMDELDDAKEDLNNAKINQETAQTNLNNINAKVENADSAEKLLEAHKENRAKLAEQLQKGEAKLEEMKSDKKQEKQVKPEQFAVCSKFSNDEQAKCKMLGTVQAGNNTYKHLQTTDGKDVFVLGDKVIDENTYNTLKTQFGELGEGQMLDEVIVDKFTEVQGRTVTNENNETIAEYRNEQGNVMYKNKTTGKDVDPNEYEKYEQLFNKLDAGDTYKEKEKYLRNKSNM